ncbi:MAG: hypothetical protein MJ170_01215 [Alphaproteobacteria bacterium]|nr:hypothetical protein [Alphaproteobacteria bacterium]
MKTKTVIYSLVAFMILPNTLWGASCSRANLTKCLDSVCAINFSSNPAARCQYCGTSSAGTPPTSKMRTVTTGSTKYMLTDKELKSAPTDPGQRYVWATRQCLEKVADCTADDVTDTYDKLIEQSCTAAGVSAEMKNLTANVSKTKSESVCSGEISACVTRENKCGTNYSNCKTDSDFDRVFSECATDATGCESFTASIKQTISQSKDSVINALETNLESIVLAHQQNRANKILSIQNGCKDNSARDACVKTVCANNMRNKCENESEKTMAQSLCKFYDIACGTLK